MIRCLDVLLCDKWLAKHPEQKKALENIFTMAELFRDFISIGGRNRDGKKVKTIKAVFDDELLEFDMVLPYSMQKSIRKQLKGNRKGILGYKSVKNDEDKNAPLNSDLSFDPGFVNKEDVDVKKDKPLSITNKRPIVGYKRYNSPYLPTKPDIYRFRSIPLNIYIPNIYGSEVLNQIDIDEYIKRKEKKPLIIETDKHIYIISRPREKVLEKFAITKGVFFIHKVTIQQKDGVTKKVYHLSPVFYDGSSTHSFNKQLGFVWLAGVNGPIKCRGLKRLPRRIKRRNAYLIKRGRNFYLRIVYEIDTERLKRNRINKYRAKRVALDFGLGKSNHITLSNGVQIYLNSYKLERLEKKISGLQSKISKMKKGSRAWRRLYKRMSDLLIKYSSIKIAAFCKILNVLKGYDEVAFQDDSLKDIAKNSKKKAKKEEKEAGKKQEESKVDCKNTEKKNDNSTPTARSKSFGREVRRYGLGYLKRLLKSSFIKTIAIERFERTSKICSFCGFQKDDLSLNDRVFKCDACGVVLDRDLNAARNIYKKAFGVDTVPTPTKRELRALCLAIKRVLGRSTQTDTQKAVCFSFRILPVVYELPDKGS